MTIGSKGVLTDRDIVVKALAKGRDPATLNGIITEADVATHAPEGQDRRAGRGDRRQADPALLTERTRHTAAGQRETGLLSTATGIRNRPGGAW